MAHSALGVILRPDKNLAEMLAPFLYYEPDDEDGLKYMVEEHIEDELRRTYEYRKEGNESVVLEKILAIVDYHF